MSKLLCDKELNDAWENAFDKPVYLDHKPTLEEIFTIRLRAVAQAQLDKTIHPIKDGKGKMNEPGTIMPNPNKCGVNLSLDDGDMPDGTTDD